MKKISIIYWSQGGHVKDMAEAIAKGVEEKGGQVKIMEVKDARVNEVLDSYAVAFGSPSMDHNRIEQDEMQPFVSQFKSIPVDGKKIVLFGSYGWDNGEFMQKWVKQMTDYDFNIIDSFCIKEAPNKEDLKKCEELGAKLVK